MISDQPDPPSASEEESSTDPSPSPQSESSEPSPAVSSPPTLEASSLAPPSLSPRSVSTTPIIPIPASSNPLGALNASRRPPSIPALSTRGSGLNISQDIAARVKAFHLGRQGSPRTQSSSSDGALSSSPTLASPAAGGALAGGVPANFRLPGGKPAMHNLNSAPAVPGLRGPPAPKLSLMEKRGMKLPGGLPGAQSNGAAAPQKRNKPGLSLSQMGGGDASSTGASESKPSGGTMMDKYSDFIDTKTGSLRFKGKATLNADGVEFAGGKTFTISLDDVDTLDELGKGNYGTVYKVRHSRPKMRKPGQGLAGNKSAVNTQSSSCSVGRKSLESSSPDDPTGPPTPTRPSGGTTGAIMAMKEIRLELDDAKFAAIIMELDILHKCLSPFIIDFFGAFFQEGAVYICMEFMDGGSIDKLYGDGIPENVLRKITYATTMGLKNLKEEHNIIHRDVKPTNILMNTRGQIKICDFGVSGNLVASIAKTNIGCQSYMAPERISSGGLVMAGANPGNGTYSVQSDIWSLGLTIIECAMGRYPYPPETYNNIFSQLSAIVDGEPPDLPDGDAYSDAARNFVSGCLHKIPNLRPTYAMLLQHVWLAPLVKPDTIVEEDEDEDDEPPKPAAAPAEVNTESPVDLTTTSTASLASSHIVDKEVADWVAQAIEKRRNGTLGKSEKPALHAAPLDAVKTPGMDAAQMKAGIRAMMEDSGGLDGAVAAPPPPIDENPSPAEIDAKDFAAL